MKDMGQTVPTCLKQTNKNKNAGFTGGWEAYFLLVHTPCAQTLA